MISITIVKKIKNRLWSKLIFFTRNKWFYPLVYKSYWHFLFKVNSQSKNIKRYYTAVPNPGAGIGHQMANWIAGYWFARQFGLQFAHIPFSNSKWESFLGFGVNEIKVADLLKSGYKKVTLPLFNEFNLEELDLNKKIIESYNDQKVFFVAEQDQFYQDQFGVVEDIRKKFHTAPAREKDNLIYDDRYFNVAIHVRRGDIVIGQKNQNPNLLLRWQGNDYFEKVLKTVLDYVETDRPIAIYLFSQGKVIDFPEFDKFPNVHFCLDMNAQDSFLHMVSADLLITSKSSFSYKPALLCNGIKVCPKFFWHGYPKVNDWIMVDNQGCFEIDELKKFKSE